MKQNIAEALACPFTPEQIKNRQGPGGKRLDYIEAHTVIARLNQALGGDWSFEVAEHRVLDNEVMVVGKLTVHVEPELVKTAVGCQDIKTDRNGNIISVGNDLKAAASDALKKCSTLLGVGLHLYGAGAQRPPHNNGQQGRDVNGHDSRHGARSHTVHHREVRGHGNGGGNGAEHTIRDPSAPLSLAQMKCIYGVAKGHGMHNKAVATMVDGMFGKVVDDLTKSEASAVIDRLKQ